MTAIAIPNASEKAYRYWFNLNPVTAVPGTHNLEVQSQYLASREPGHLERQLQIQLDDVDLALLHEWLGRYLKLQELRSNNS